MNSFLFVENHQQDKLLFETKKLKWEYLLFKFLINEDYE